jgi:hypothetical protein
LVWADEEPEQNSSTNLDIHADFKLNKTSGYIGLINNDLVVVDSVTYGLQDDDVSEGRFPDGAAAIEKMHVPTPRASNKRDNNQPPGPAQFSEINVSANGQVSFSFESEIGRTYILQHKDDLNELEWHELVRKTATGTTTTIEDLSPEFRPQRFYRLVSLP